MKIFLDFFSDSVGIMFDIMINIFTKYLNTTSNALEMQIPILILTNS